MSAQVYTRKHSPRTEIATIVAPACLGSDLHHENYYCIKSVRQVGSESVGKEQSGNTLQSR